MGRRAQAKRRLQYAGASTRGGFSTKSTSPTSHTDHPYGATFPALSLAIRKRDNYTCMAHKIGLPRCSNRYPPPFHHLLHAHHIRSRRGPADDTPNNLITLCKDCHGLEHRRPMGKPITNRQKSVTRNL